jgi:hypothetical protein
MEPLKKRPLIMTTTINVDEEEANRLEFQRSIMRGTLALDEDDAAHLQHLQRQKEAEMTAQSQYTETQLACFRTAQAERFELATTTTTSTVLDDKEYNVYDSKSLLHNTSKVRKTPFTPAITIKKRRRQQEQESETKCSNKVEFTGPEQDEGGTKVGVTLDVNDAMKLTDVSTTDSNNRAGTLSSLLSGYSSDEND